MSLIPVGCAKEGENRMTMLEIMKIVIAVGYGGCIIGLIYVAIGLIRHIRKMNADAKKFEERWKNIRIYIKDKD